MDIKIGKTKTIFVISLDYKTQEEKAALDELCAMARKESEHFFIFTNDKEEKIKSLWTELLYFPGYRFKNLKLSRIVSNDNLKSAGELEIEIKYDCFDKAYGTF